MDPKQYNKLKEIWEKKLEDSGLYNIEQKDGKLKKWSTRFIGVEKFGNISIEEKIESYKAIEEYFILAGQFLHGYTFENTLDKLIWSLHADGLSIREIVKKLKENNNIKIDKMSVHTIKTKLVTEMRGFKK